VALALKHLPKVILLDILLPGLDGYSVCRELKSKPELKDTKVLMLSALNTPEDKLKATEVGADGFVEKPVLTEKLLTVLKEIVP
jgi:two-component system alkaline phosphatase synthesis response regulator PhoP